MALSLIGFINTYPFLFILVILMIPAMVITVLLARGRHKQGQITIVNQTQSPSQPDSTEDKELNITGHLDEAVMQRLFGMGRKIKNGVIATLIAIPFLIISYIISENLWITIALFAIFILFGYFWAKKWVKPEGVQIILDGDIEPGNPKAGVEHIDYIIPYEQWKYIIFTDQGGAYPIKTLDGMAYRATSISFWDPEEKIVKDIELAWMHSPHSNFEQEHDLNHRLATWLKIVLKELNIYRHLLDVLSIIEGKNISDRRENLRLAAKGMPSRIESEINNLLDEINELDIEQRNIRRTGKENKEKIEKSQGASNSEGTESDAPGGEDA